VEIGGFAVNHMKTWNFVETKLDDKDVLQNYSVNPPDVYGFGHQAYYDNFVNCIRNNGPQFVDGHAGRKSLELICAIYESIEAGKEVFLRFKPKIGKLGK
jgi:predicted dehydrogenase